MEKTIKIPIYSGKLIIIQSDNFSDIEKKYNLVSLEDYSAFCFKKQNNSSTYVMVFGVDVTAGIIAHESFHVVTTLFEDSLITIDNNNDEPAAYLLGWIVEQCHKFLNIK
jgi:hypothetical protein